ncbi:glycosyl hydrolase family 18 protein [Motilimonas sp. KMU-193]|uniref:glycosyl hydrolase family 18 protein n=1 Tax=Motilimonas sp. KMU-193 TaxID=3388668 RepID=UPI00396B0ABD
MAAFTAHSSELVKMGFYRDWSVYSPNYHITDVPDELLTHLVYENAVVTLDGQVRWGDEYASISAYFPHSDVEVGSVAGSMGQLQQLKRRNKKIKSVISIGGWNRVDTMSQVMNDPHKRAKFVPSLADFVQQYEFDGIDLNWIAPALNPSNVQWRTADFYNLTKLVKELKQMVDQLSLASQRDIELMLSVPVSRQSLQYWHIGEIYPLVDYVILLSDQQATHDNIAVDHINPLFTSSQASASSIDYLVSDIIMLTGDASKLVLTIPPFAMAWQGVQPLSDELIGAPIVQASQGTWDSKGLHSGVLHRDHLFRLVSSGGYQEKWDELSQSSYLYHPHQLNGHVISYESQRALSSKIQYVEDKQLAGVAFSQLHNDSQGWHSVVTSTYREMDPIALYWTWLSAYIVKHGAEVIVLLIVALYWLGWLLWRRWHQQQDKRANAQLEQNFLLLQHALQSLTHPLDALVRLRQGRHFATQQVESPQWQMLQKLASQTQTILENSRLGSELRQAVAKPFSVLDVIHSAKHAVDFGGELFRVHLTNADDCLVVNNDADYLYQALLILFGSANLRGAGHVNIRLGRQQSKLVIEFLILKQAGRPNFDSELAALTPFVRRLQSQLCVEQNELHHIITIALRDVTQGRLNQLSRGRGEQVVSSIDCLALVSDFSAHGQTVFSLEKMVEEAFNSFSRSFARTALAVYQGRNLVYSTSDTPLTGGEEVVKIMDYSFHLAPEQAQDEEIAVLKTLTSQINMAWCQISNLVRTPRLLAEIYEISSNREKIEYIQAEQGYSGIYIQGKTAPIYITLRLKPIKYYFDEHAFLQIHRSYLVNPAKVKRVRQLSRTRYELELDNGTKLPFARSYVDSVQAKWPQWFRLR